MMTRKITWFTALALGLTPFTHAETPAAPPTQSAVMTGDAVLVPAALGDAPLRDVKYPFAKIAPPPGLLRVKLTVSEPSASASSEMVTLKVLDELSPSAQFRVPEAAW